jgi:hypothetical protein
MDVVKFTDRIMVVVRDMGTTLVVEMGIDKTLVVVKAG